MPPLFGESMDGAIEVLQSEVGRHLSDQTPLAFERAHHGNAHGRSSRIVARDAHLGTREGRGAVPGQFEDRGLAGGGRLQVRYTLEAS